MQKNNYSKEEVISSYIISDIESVCENVAVLDAGLLFAGTLEALVKRAEVMAEDAFTEQKLRVNPQNMTWT